MDRYNKYIIEYGKDFDYETLIFKNNLIFIEGHNQKNESYKLEVNDFTDQKSSNNHFITSENGNYEIDDSICIKWPLIGEKGAVTHVKESSKLWFRADSVQRVPLKVLMPLQMESFEYIGTTIN